MASEKVQLPPSTAKVDFSKAIDTSSLKGQSVLITGGANDIGEAFVEALAEAGAYVTVFDFNADLGNALAKRLSDKGQKVQFTQGDVRSYPSQLAAFQSALSFPPTPSLDIVIPCAGINGNSILNWLDIASASSSDPPAAPDTRVLDVNVTGAWYTVHLALHYFRLTLPPPGTPAPSKQIVFVGSLASYTAVPYVTDYSGAKYAIRGIWRAIRAEAGLLGDDTQARFRTSLIAPTYIKTNLTAVLEEPLRQAGIWMAERGDVVEALLRIVGDEGVVGRAVAVVAAGKSFDLCDDFEGHDAGREWKRNVEEGVFGYGLVRMSEINRARKTLAE